MKRKITALILTFSILLAMLLPASAVSFPDGVTEENAAESAVNLDKLIEKAIPLIAENKSLSEAVDELLLKDETLSGFFSALYGSMDDYSGALGILGIDVSPAALSAALDEFPEVSAAVGSVSSYSDGRA